MDQEWSTVGSSNLDPLSLSLNLEANLIIRDPAFNRELCERLAVLMDDHCKQIQLERILKGWFWRAPLGFVIFHFLRHFPALVGWFPAHRPKLALLHGNAPPELVVLQPEDSQPAYESEKTP